VLRCALFQVWSGLPISGRSQYFLRFLPCKLGLNVLILRSKDSRVPGTWSCRVDRRTGDRRLLLVVLTEERVLVGKNCSGGKGSAGHRSVTGQEDVTEAVREEHIEFDDTSVAVDPRTPTAAHHRDGRPTWKGDVS